MPPSQQASLYGLKGGNIGHHGVECVICLSPAEEPVVTPCRHVFCWHCLNSWLREHITCPVCRNDLLMKRETQLIAKPVASNHTRDLPPVHASGTLEQGAFGEAIQMPPVLNIPRSRVVRLADAPSREPLESRYYRSEHASGNSERGWPFNYGASAHHHSSRVGIPPTSLQPTALRQASRNGHQIRASGHRNPTDRIPHFASSSNIGNAYSNESADDVSRQGPSMRIDSQRMLAVMRAEANHLAHARGISQRMDYCQAAKVVYRRWTQVIVRKSDQTTLRRELMWLLGEEMIAALADACIVDFNNDEVIPQRLLRYLHDVARRGIDS